MRNDRPTSATALRIALAIGLLAGGLACGDRAGSGDQTREVYQFPVSVELSDTEGNPVAEAPVKLDGETVGYTDEAGRFEGSLREKPGTEIQLALGDLDGYRYVDGASTTEILELKPSLSGEGRKGVEVLLHADAESVKRRYLVWLKANCNGDALSDDHCRELTVERDGEPVTTTDRFGSAHLAFRERSGEKVTVSVESPSVENGDENDDKAPEVEPTSPTYRFETALESTVYLLEPTFRGPDEESDDRRPRRRRQPSTASTTSSDGGSGDSGGTAESSTAGGSESSAGDPSEDDVDIKPTERTDSPTGGDSLMEAGGGSSGSGGSDDGDTKSGSGDEKKSGAIDLFGD